MKPHFQCWDTEIEMTWLQYKVEDRYINKHGFCNLSCVMLRYNSLCFGITKEGWQNESWMVVIRDTVTEKKKVTFELLLK